MKIRLLGEETINQIAAGEVVERPLNIVKELIENSIDAGSSSISIDIKEGGIGMIRVTDNGLGIPQEDVRNAFLRHATSKISSAKDLTGIRTFGFRGEALSSIAAVSEVEMITKTAGALFATHYILEYGKEKEFSEIGAPEGTTFVVRNLFQNLPARKKFLKSAQAEAAQIQDILEKEAIAHPEVSVRFQQDGKLKFQTLGNGSLRDVIYTIYGKDITEELLPVNRKYLKSPVTGLPSLSVRGFLGKPAACRTNRNFELFFVNSRFIRNSILAKALEDGYRAFLMQHRFPFAVLFLDINPEIVDVNVHPQKMEVRFSDNESIYNAVMDSVKQTLLETEMIASALHESRGNGGGEKDPGRPPEQHIEPFEKKRQAAIVNNSSQIAVPPVPAISPAISDDISPASKTLRESEVFYGGSQNRDDREAEKKENEADRNSLYENSSHYVSGQQESLFSKRFLTETAREEHRIIGQLFDTYWLVEYNEHLYIIDQHAAHEKVNFERLNRRLRAKAPVSQFISPPIILTLSERESLALNENMDAFEALGYEIRNFGGKDYAISAIPADLPEIGKKELLHELLDQLASEKSTFSSETVYDKLASMSCKAAVKGKHRMDAREADALIGELLSLDNPYACPHGRPTIISMSKNELEKRFKRIV